jgi:hypothetical protein
MTLTDEMKARIKEQQTPPTSTEQLPIEERAALVEEGAHDIVKNKPRGQRSLLIRQLNEQHGSPYDKDELKLILASAAAKCKDEREGAKPLTGIETILGAAVRASTTSGYLIKHIIPKASFTLFSGPPKVGKTSILMAMLIRAFVGEEGVTGLKSKTFSHLTVYSDDQRPADTARYINAALHGLEDPEAAISKLKGLPISIHPNLMLDDEGRDRLTEQAEAMPGGVFVIDSLTSTAGKLGYDENSSEIGRVIYDLRESIQSVDPTATVILIHHMKKGNGQGNSPTDRVRGSSAITGAVDNILNIDRPVTGTDQSTVTPDRVLYLSGRNISESEIIVRSDFNYTTEYDMETEEEYYTLKTISLEYLCTAKDYAMHKKQPEETKAHRDWLTDAEWDIIQFLSSKRGPQYQKHIGKDSGNTSRLISDLLKQHPCLIEEHPCEGRSKMWKMVDGWQKLLSAKITNPNVDF